MTRKSWTRRNNELPFDGYMKVSAMKDNELRGIVLQKFYEHRREPRRCWQASDFPSDMDLREWNRICGQLKEYNYITWECETDSGHIDGQPAVIRFSGDGHITALGVDVAEGTKQASISITIDHSRTVNVSGSNNIVGDNNYLNLEKVNSEISRSNFPEVEKAEAKSLWQKVCDNKLLNTVVGSVFGAATKHALETTQPK